MANSSKENVDLTTQQNIATAAIESDFPVVGLPGSMFTVLHVVALCSLSTTILISSGLLVYLFVTNSRHRQHSRQHQRHPDDSSNGRTGGRSVVTAAEKKTTFPNGAGHNKKVAEYRPFWSWNVGERMVVYLAICDLLEGVSHTLDHAYMFHTRSNPPDSICSPMAFFLIGSILSQWFVVIFSAISACSLIVFGKKLPVGRYDWRLLLGTFGLGVTLAALAWGFRTLGPSGAWCLLDLRSQIGQRAMGAFGMFEICTFGILAVSYGAIWIKIQRTTRLMTNSAGDNRYRNSARVMMIFVAVYIIQWWSLVAFTIWSWVAPPQIGMLITVVLFVNLGGLYNCIAYTVIRRRMQKQNTSRSQNGVVFEQTTATTATVASSTTSLAMTTIKPTVEERM